MAAIADTQYYADSCEFIPSPLVSGGIEAEGAQRYLVCGTYQLEESSNTRIGKLLLYSVLDGRLQPFYEAESPGILDIKWSTKPIAHHNLVLAQALADGSLALSYLNDKTSSMAFLAAGKRDIGGEKNNDAPLMPFSGMGKSPP